MQKKQKSKKDSLDVYEQSISDALDLKKLKSPSAAKQKKIQAAAREALRDLKSARANIRMNEADLNAIRSLADSSGMPYQTLITYSPLRNRTVGQYAGS